MSIGKPLFIGFPWARRFGDRRSILLHCGSCSPDNGTNFWQTVYFWQTGHQYVERWPMTLWRMDVPQTRQGSPFRS